MESDTKKSLALSAVSSIGYAGAIWVFFNAGLFPKTYQVMSTGFLVGMPLIMGALINHFVPSQDRGKASNLLYKPVGYVLLSMAAAFLVKMEGMICLVMAAPILVITSGLGAVLHYRISLALSPAQNRKSMLALAFMPIVIAPMESAIEQRPLDTETVTRIRIDAPVETVWKKIIRVEAIRGEELEERERISFTIIPNTDDIPPTTLDEHVIVGGPYFNVLRGTYEIVDFPGPGVELILISHHRTTTHFNAYSGLWGRLIMRDIQNRILAVIKRRCESAKAHAA